MSWRVKALPNAPIVDHFYLVLRAHQKAFWAKLGWMLRHSGIWKDSIFRESLNSHKMSNE